MSDTSTLAGYLTARVQTGAPLSFCRSNYLLSPGQPTIPLTILPTVRLGYGYRSRKRFCTACPLPSQPSTSMDGGLTYDEDSTGISDRPLRSPEPVCCPESTPVHSTEPRPISSTPNCSTALYPPPYPAACSPHSCTGAPAPPPPPIDLPPNCPQQTPSTGPTEMSDGVRCGGCGVGVTVSPISETTSDRVPTHSAIPHLPAS